MDCFPLRQGFCGQVVATLLAVTDNKKLGSFAHFEKGDRLMSTANRTGGFISHNYKTNLKPSSPAYAEASADKSR
jgi:hypothetical protein